jgi:stage III sporulation protein SpoIIIAA
LTPHPHNLHPFFCADAFNRTIKLYQTVASLSQNNHTEISTDEDASAPQTCSACESAVVTPSQSFTVKDIMKNSALAKLIVLAARKVKAQRMATP